MKSLNPENRLSIQSLSVLCGALLTATILLSISSANAASPFTTEGKFSVGSDGSANYSIPIVVPPGTAGMQPQLALNYSSNGGNGIVGMGWGIDGLSQIGRCPTTLEQDGVINGVNYTNTDRFCLDGQRLIATTDTYNTTTKQYTTTSAYGANGTEYRTESANFAKIISYGQAGTGPASFKVWTKSGQIIEYGNTADSGIEAQGKPTIRTWGVNKISDTKGNYIAVTYTEDNANGEAYVQKIDYTGNASSTPAVTPYANIQFTYETRPDITTGYQAGSVLKTTKRLTNIQTYNATTLIKNYKLTYELSQSTNRSRLKTVQECDGNSTSNCKSSNTINWTSINNSFAAGEGWGTGNGLGYWPYHSLADTDAMFQFSGDFNGDGRADYMYWDGAKGGWQMLISTGNTFAPVQNWGAGGGTGYWPYYTTSTSQSFQFTGDFNGDGKTDFMYWDETHGGWQALISTGTTFAPVQNWGTGSGTGYWPYSFSTPTSQSFQFTGDFNGDGKTDFMYWDGAHGGWQALVSAGITFAPVQNWGGAYYPYFTDNVSQSFQFIGDFNGDGKTDVMYWLNGTQGWQALISTGTTFAAQSWGTGGGIGYYPYAGSAVSQSFQFTGDFNGDGKTDVMYWLNGTQGWQALISTGAAFAPVQSWGTGGGNGYYPYADSAVGQSFQFTGDFNGDGKTDVMYWLNGTQGWQALISTGAVFAPVQSWGAGGGTGYYPAAGSTPTSQSFHLTDDFDGDGKTDFMYWDGYQGWRLLSNEVKYQPDLLASAAFSSSTSVVYKPITDGLIYAKDTSSIYPFQDVQSPVFVVSSTTTSDAIGGVVTTNYQYGGLKSHLGGRGSLGFRYVKESSPDSGLGVTTFYRQDFPFIGLPCQVEKRRLSDNALLSVVQNTYANSDLATSTIISKFPYLSQSVEQAYELDGALVSTTATTNQYDNYGNVTSVRVDDGLGNIKTTTSTYNNDVGNWLLGRLIRSTVTSMRP